LFDITEDDAKDSFSDGAVQTEEAKTRSIGGEVSSGEDNETAIHTAEEKLAVSKKEAIQDATLIKEPIRETKTFQVQLKHEELVIEKRLVEKRSTSSNSEDVIRSKTEITIPLKKEDLIVEKKPYVNEEVVINKKPVTETKSISEQFISEKVNVKTDEGVENGARE
jgi:uncharacterized protein (TIGR02271 family)